MKRSIVLLATVFAVGLIDVPAMAQSSSDECELVGLLGRKAKKACEDVAKLGAENESRESSREAREHQREASKQRREEERQQRLADANARREADKLRTITEADCRAIPGKSIRTAEVGGVISRKYCSNGFLDYEGVTIPLTAEETAAFQAYIDMPAPPGMVTEYECIKSGKQVYHSYEGNVISSRSCSSSVTSNDSTPVPLRPDEEVAKENYARQQLALVSADIDGKYSWATTTIGDFSNASAKACSDPAGFNDLVVKLERSGNGLAAKIMQVATPTRNAYQVFMSDMMAYQAYYPNACERAEKVKACLPGVNATAEQTCDCLAGYPGEVSTGIGAGEMILRENSKLALAACSVAASRTSGQLKLRYSAQRARALTYDSSGTRKGGEALKSVIASGFARANIDMVRAYVHSVEFLGSPPSILDEAEEFLKAAQKAGAKEVRVAAISLQQVLEARGMQNAYVQATFSDPPPRECKEESNTRMEYLNGRYQVVGIEYNCSR